MGQTVISFGVVIGRARNHIAGLAAAARAQTGADEEDEFGEAWEDRFAGAWGNVVDNLFAQHRDDVRFYCKAMDPKGFDALSAVWHVLTLHSLPHEYWKFFHIQVVLVTAAPGFADAWRPGLEWIRRTSTVDPETDLVVASVISNVTENGVVTARSLPESMLVIVLDTFGPPLL